MGNNNQKIKTVAFLLAAGLCYWAVSLLLVPIFDMFAASTSTRENVWIQHGAPLLAGLVVFSVLTFHKGISVWSEEVIVELKKVVWPTLEQTRMMTIVVCIMVLISGVVLGLFDAVAGTTLTSGISMLSDYLGAK